MTQVAGSLKNDAACVFDWVRHNHHQTGDLGLILQKDEEPLQCHSHFQRAAKMRLRI